MEDKQYVDSGEIRCICEFSEDDGFTIQCDRCLVWQHIECLGIAEDALPDLYRCERCLPREVDVARAVRIQSRKLGLRKPKNAKLIKAKRPGERGRRGSRGPESKASTAPSPGSTVNRPGRKKRKMSATTSPRDSARDGSRARSPKPKKPSHTSDPLGQLYNTLIQNKTWFRSYPPLVPLSYSKKAKYILCSSSLQADNPRDIVLVSRNDIEASRSEVVLAPQETTGTRKSRPQDGVFALKPITPGQFLFEVTGQPMMQSTYFKNSDNLFRLMGTLTSTTKFHPSINLGVISSDSTGLSNRIRSHCSPNSELRSFYIEGGEPVIRLGVFATTTISANDEVRIPWTLCGDLLPNGLIDQYDDEVTFKQTSYYSFNEIFKELKRGITSEKARRMISIMRTESCSCQQEPSCLINSFFKVRRFFYSKVQLSDLYLPNEKSTRNVAANSSTSYPTISVPAPNLNSDKVTRVDNDEDTSSTTSQDLSNSNSAESKAPSDAETEITEHSLSAHPSSQHKVKDSDSMILSRSSPEMDPLPHDHRTRSVTPQKRKLPSFPRASSSHLERSTMRDSPGGDNPEISDKLTTLEASRRIEKLRGMSLLKYFLSRWKADKDTGHPTPQPSEEFKPSNVDTDQTSPSLKDFEPEPETVKELSTPPIHQDIAVQNSRPISNTSQRPLRSDPLDPKTAYQALPTSISPTLRQNGSDKPPSPESRRLSVASIKSKGSNPPTPKKKKPFVPSLNLSLDSKPNSLSKDYPPELDGNDVSKKLPPHPKSNVNSIPEIPVKLGPRPTPSAPGLPSRYPVKLSAANSSTHSTPASLTRPGSPSAFSKLRDLEVSRPKRPKPNDNYPRPRVTGSNLTVSNRDESEAEEGEISHFSESPVPESMRTNEFSHPQHPTKADRGKFFHYPPAERDRHPGFGYDRHTRDYSRGPRDIPREGPRDSPRDLVGMERGHRGPIRSRGNPRYPPSPPMNYRVEDRYPPRRDRAWNGDSSLDYHSPGPHSSIHHDPPPYRSHTPLSIPNFYRNGSNSHSYHVNPHSLSNGNSHSLSNGGIHVNSNGSNNLPPASHRRHAVPAPPPLSTPDVEQ